MRRNISGKNQELEQNYMAMSICIAFFYCINYNVGRLLFGFVVVLIAVGEHSSIRVVVFEVAVLHVHLRSKRVLFILFVFFILF